MQESTAATRPARATPALARFQRNCLVARIVFLVAAAWAYLGYQTWAMQHMDSFDMAMPGLGRWTIVDVLLVYVIVEKLLPPQRWLAPLTGVIMILVGVIVVLA